MSEETTIYLDHHATTPVDPRVVDTMTPYFTEHYGNPASDDHGYGARANGAVEDAREQIASAIHSRPEEIIFTSGATEADNLAIQGVMEYAIENGHGNHFITTAIEHEAVLELCEEVESIGGEVTVLPVDENGSISIEDVKDAIRPETVLLSVIAANNEIGTIAPLKELGQITSNNQVIFHSDAVQALGYQDLDVERLEIDLMSLSGHKIYGPKGVGALYVRRRRPKIKLKPLIYGGGHERGWRSGTLNVPGIAGMGKAVKLAETERQDRIQHVEGLRDHLWREVESRLDDVVLNGPPITESRLPNNLNVSFIGVENKAFVRKLRSDIAVSAGSACTTGSVEASHVLQAISGSEDRQHSAVRFGLGKDNTKEEISRAVDLVEDAVNSLRRLSF
jgi:cysteine desulfurase